MVADTDCEDHRVIVDPDFQLSLKRQDLLEEAKRERLLAQLPRSHSGMRHELALACLRVANWLDARYPDEYGQASESGPTDWAVRSASM